ncbi:carbon-phosphorus lyase complex subunit PhnI [Streptomyces sp. MP131-18]|uniref:carbon-phosphorus lyase complex subunit PhnI n=1 Tax=Streptomyces sp. MP131-18 TaxID=1857892 RepID=UPI00097CBF69|nr:carbon-phosphorus lyase complex subunit PhnI [Streptomyces sp. MP131-18]ONK09702.1 Alpha-D-ribose 1-methylphosphonate 5-triphosphate synthase subunit PhnI [Streptomyces sp. MP131-18]
MSAQAKDQDAAVGGTAWLELDQITERLGLGVDRVMGEAGLWAPELAARALRQAHGDPPEAAQLLRAHRTALPRLAIGEPVSTTELKVVRRISSAFRNPPGGQVLGRTLDYVGRLLDLMPEDEGKARNAGSPHAEDTRPHAHDHAHDHRHRDPDHAVPEEAVRTPAHVLATFRDMGLVAPPRGDGDPEPFDITRRPARPGAPRSAWLQTMARADTGSLLYLWYGSDWRPAGHEVPGELRHGILPLRVRHPHTGRPVTVAETRVSEVQTFHSLPRAGELPTSLDVGYGLCFGHNERKAISMAGLDLLLAHHEGATDLQHDVLLTLDGPDSTGYTQHLKLPHHVEYRSVLERAHAAARGTRLTERDTA